MESVRGVGARVGVIRRRRGLTQAELAGRIGRSAEAVSSLERGKHLPSLDILQRLAAALDMPIQEFFAPAAEAESPEHAALYGELLDTARTLPLAELDLTVRIVATVARWHADGR
jgi:transcriptional regulator with XRE-family HTH domain